MDALWSWMSDNTTVMWVVAASVVINAAAFLASAARGR